jgi:hypothetical protein
MVSQPLCQINSGEGALADFSFGFKKLMEVPLVDFLLQLNGPLLSDCGVARVEHKLLRASFALKLYRSWDSEAGLILCDSRVTGIDS